MMNMIIQVLSSNDNQNWR